MKCAYIDGANLHNGIKSFDWDFDYGRLRVWLSEKYSVLVSSDGDYTPLIKFLNSKNKLEVILSPYDTKKCSVLLKRTGAKISYISEQRIILESKKEKVPNADGTASGSFS